LEVSKKTALIYNRVFIYNSTAALLNANIHVQRKGVQANIYKHYKFLALFVIYLLNQPSHFYAPQRVKHIVASLSVRPVPCPANNFKTTVGI